MGKEIAKCLNLPDPNLYTGHCFRRSSATILIDAGGDITSLKRHGGWKSTTVAENYIDESIQNKVNVANQILNSIEYNQTTSSVNIITSPPKSIAASTNIVPEVPQLQFNHCTIQNLIINKTNTM